MITETTGNLLTTPVEALVNTVNTEGVMGKGIALQFKKAFPAMFREYAVAAKRGEIRLGHMTVWPTQALDGPKYVINFPTKAHWRAKSRLADVESGLEDLIRVVRELGIRSIAVPPLGCGNGGLNWADVEPLIRNAFESVPDVDVRLFAPSGAPAASEMPMRTSSPRMSAGRAALIGILDRYSKQALNAPSVIETQKLMYFMQVAGEDLRLNFKPNRYGPYADNLRHVLIEVEGHFIAGYGDGSARVLDAAPLEPVSGAVELAEQFLLSKPMTKERMSQVLDLAAGYESAYGMELLATVHWLASADDVGSTDETIVERVAAWSPRKAQMFTPMHVRSALDTLRRRGWLPEVA